MPWASWALQFQDDLRTIPKTHVKEGGWRWAELSEWLTEHASPAVWHILTMPDPAHPSSHDQVLEEPEPEAKLVKPPPVATAPVQTFTPKAGCQKGPETCWNQTCNYQFIEGSLEVKLPTIWTVEKQRWEESEETRSEEDAGARKGRNVVKHWKSRNTVFFQWFVAPVGRKVGSLKRRVRSQLARWVMKNCTPLWREAHFQVKMYKAHQVRTTLGSWDVEKVHAVVARSTFPSQNVQNAPAPDHFWKLRCRKSARRCGAKHISKSKCTKHTSSGPLLEVEKPLWRGAHFEVKMLKN